MTEYRELKTSWRQRVVIMAIVIVLIGSTVALYMGLVLSGGTPSDKSTDDTLAELEAKYTSLQTELESKSAPLSAQYFGEFAPYKSEVKAYNAAAVTELKIEDLKVGDGEEIVEGAKNYLAYYIGWCADEAIFDSSLNSTTDPTSLKPPLPGGDMIAGWNQGIIGMKIGGIRRLTIPGELAYGDSQEICGGKNSPLKFVVMAIPPDSAVVELWDKVNEVSNEIMMYYYGIYQ
jgi:FKBP-type peptidyl-prolyl cis-trans isomerase